MTAVILCHQINEDSDSDVYELRTTF